MGDMAEYEFIEYLRSNDSPDIYPEKGVFERLLMALSKTSPLKQITIGASSGFLTGLLAMKIGRVAALALGGGIILLELASDKGYIKINWEKVNENLDEVADSVKRRENNISYLYELAKFRQVYTIITSGFIGGFLIGLGTH